MGRQSNLRFAVLASRKVVKEYMCIYICAYIYIYVCIYMYDIYIYMCVCVHLVPPPHSEFIETNCAWLARIR